MDSHPQVTLYMEENGRRLASFRYWPCRHRGVLAVWCTLNRRPTAAVRQKMGAHPGDDIGLA